MAEYRVVNPDITKLLLSVRSQSIHRCRERRDPHGFVLPWNQGAAPRRIGYFSNAPDNRDCNLGDAGLGGFRFVRIEWGQIFRQQGVKQAASGISSIGQIGFQLMTECHQLRHLCDDSVLLGVGWKGYRNSVHSILWQATSSSACLLAESESLEGC
jgi:hypothetical protein